MVKSIMFICGYNRTRSQIAEKLFNKLNKNKKYKAVSAGFVGGKYIKDKDLEVVLKKRNLRVEKPKTIDLEILRKQYHIIIVANEVPKGFFKRWNKQMGMLISKWNVKDAWQRKGKTRVDRLEKVYLDLDGRIKKLVYKLNK